MNALRARWQALWERLQQWYGGHSRRDQRIILGVLAFAAVCIAYLWAWVPLRDYRQTVADEIGEGQEQLARAARILGSADSLRAERESLEKRLKQSRERLLPGRGGTLGAAALQERTNALASEKGITVQSTQVMKEEALDPYRKVSVRLTLSGELKPFAELVSGLEYGHQLAIPIVEVNRRGAVAGAKGPRTLSATLEVTGFVLSEEAKAEEAPPAEAGEAGDAAAEGADAAAGPTGAPTGGPTGPAADSGAPTRGTGPAGAEPATGAPAVAPTATTSTTPAPAAAQTTATTRPATTSTTVRRRATTSTTVRRRATTSTTGRPGVTSTTTVRPGVTSTTRPAGTRPSFIPKNVPIPPSVGQEAVE